MGIEETLSGIGLKLPEGIGSGVGDVIQGIIFLLIFGVLAGAITYYISKKKQYNKHIHIFEEIAGKAVPVGMDKAKEIVLPNTSIRAYFLQKKKVYLPRPSIQTGVGHYWFFIRKDGEWINVGIENLNTKMNELKIHFDHTDMRMANASLKKLIEKNYKKLNWLKEYAPYIAIGILVVLLGVATFVGTYNTNQAASTLASTAVTNEAVVTQLSNILNSMDNICTGSGIRGA